MVKIRVAISEQRDASYDILIGRGLLADLPALVKAACPANGYAVITDSHVAKLYGEKLVARCHDAKLHVELFAFPAGEWNKTRETWAALSDRMLARHFGRDSAVIALGGGVAGDVAGFVAATYLRGIPYVQIPTTLLAMIDSSIGGKAGVDVPAGKNLLGAFHQPRLVVADLDVLGSLAAPQLAAGMAEAVKHGVIADRQYFDALEQEHEAVAAREAGALERVVRRSVEIKAAVVAADEREAGRRAILNFGHTVGHAIEATAKFATLHGEAVAIGMAYEARLAEALGIAEPGTADRVQRLLERYNLPLELPASATEDALVAAMQLDKKAREGTVRFALPQAIGRMFADGTNWTVAAPEDVVRDVLRGAARRPSITS
ncbi:MAG TPA: 3-dehydroquinate synthase [Gemmatimonadales bacterium]|nr:3-dehydroquinate synthase [Gemmatimonadales bacterium]